MTNEDVPKSLKPHEKLAEKLFAEIVGVLKDKKKPIKKTKVEFEAMKRLRIGKIFEGFLLVSEKQDIQYPKRAIRRLNLLLEKEKLSLPQEFQKYLKKTGQHEDKENSAYPTSSQAKDWRTPDWQPGRGDTPLWSPDSDTGDILLEEPFPGKEENLYKSEKQEDLHSPYIDNVKGLEGAIIIANLIYLLKDETSNWRSVTIDCIKYLKKGIEKDKKEKALKFIDQLEAFVKTSGIKYDTLRLLLSLLDKLKTSIENKKSILGTEEMEKVAKATVSNICNLSSTEIEFERILEIIKTHLANQNEREKKATLIKVLGQIQKIKKDMSAKAFEITPEIKEAAENLGEIIAIIKVLLDTELYL